MPKVKALKPDEVVIARKVSMPDAVLEVFNELITENFRGRYAVVYQEEVVKRLIKKGLDRKDIYDKGWLDVEDIYRQEGWTVVYDKPGYNESYRAYFRFSC